jgi:hypothetical protein
MVLQQMRKAAAASRDVLAGVKKWVWEVNVGGFSRLLFDLMLALIMPIALPLMVVAAALIVAAQVVFTRLRRRCRKDCRGQEQVSSHSSHAWAAFVWPPERAQVWRRGNFAGAGLRARHGGGGGGAAICLMMPVWFWPRLCNPLFAE